MSSQDDDRRFTDREVAVVLRRVRELADSLSQAARNAAQPIAALGEGGEEEGPS